MRVTTLVAAAIAAALSVPAFAGPPGWGPAHGWRDSRFHDRAYERGFQDGLREARERVRGDARSYEAGYRDGLRQARYDSRRWDDRRRDDRRDWRDDCRVRDRGNGGLVAGAALGGVLGSRIARNDPTAGAIVGAATGGLIGRSVDRNDGRC
jgi:hypothetical protein